ncbi:MAG TPA: hypothetical protein ENH05_08515 [Rhizobiales bacterium]|nr:hypothetical protein BMS3Bbin10_00399 [bacterium BMS3Bbin10]HDO52763.1 hypothetical protein [Hyphomicrobiales bacterium]
MAKVKSNGDDHWLARPENIRLVWWLFIAVLVATVLSDLAVEHKPKFGIDGTFGFAAWFGLLSCVALVAFAKALGAILKRPDTFYDG